MEEKILKEIKEGFSKTNERLDKLENKVEKLEEGQQELKEEQKKMSGQIGELKEEQKKMSGQIEELKEGQNRIEVRIENLENNQIDFNAEQFEMNKKIDKLIENDRNVRTNLTAILKMQTYMLQEQKYIKSYFEERNSYYKSI